MQPKSGMYDADLNESRIKFQNRLNSMMWSFFKAMETYNCQYLDDRMKYEAEIWCAVVTYK